jgi:Major capsid protein 13-like
MANVRLSDVIVPQVFRRYMVEDTKVKTAIFTSGILREEPVLNDFLNGGGLTVNMPFWGDLDSTAPGIANDDPSSIATPGKIGTFQNIAIRNVRTRGWSAADLVSVLAGSDPLARIRERVSNYWTRALQRQLVSELIGVFAANSASNSGDMQNVIGLDVAGAPTAANLVSAEEILNTKQTMGDAGDDLGVLIMHSVVYTRLQKNNLIDFIPDSEGRVNFPSYLGYTVIVDDGVNVTQGVTNTARFLYSTYLIARGAFGWAETPVDIPVETFRHPEQGNGMGVEDLWTRRQYIMSPYGIKWTDSSRAGQFPTDAEYQTAANWSRVFPERKQIGMALLVTNG